MTSRRLSLIHAVWASEQPGAAGRSMGVGGLVKRWMASGALWIWISGLAFGAAEARLLTAVDDAQGGRGQLRAFLAKPGFEPRGGGVPVGNGAILREAFGRVFALSRVSGTLTVLDSRRGSRRVYSLGLNSEPVDIAVVSPGTAYITLWRGTGILRLDLRTGVLEEAVDLSGFADADGSPEPGMMIVEGGRLFVQIRRYHEDAPFGIAAPAYLAVVDLATEELLDTDAAAPGVQAIELQGTAPKHRMQVVEESRRLYVSATGAFFDEGGIEAIDLDTLRSEGLVIREVDGLTGADLGAFILTTPEQGFLVYSTDLDLSSHLKAFTLEGGVEEGPELHVSVGYFVPSMEADMERRTLFVPDGGFGRNGIFLFDAQSGAPRRQDRISLRGPPSDILLMRAQLPVRRR